MKNRMFWFFNGVIFALAVLGFTEILEQSGLVNKIKNKIINAEVSKNEKPIMEVCDFKMPMFKGDKLTTYIVAEEFYYYGINKPSILIKPTIYNYTADGKTLQMEIRGERGKIELDENYDLISLNVSGNTKIKHYGKVIDEK